VAGDVPPNACAQPGTGIAVAPLMKQAPVPSPSTADAAQTPDAARTPDPDAARTGGVDRARDGRADTHASVFGQSAPRMPHERDESSDSGTGAPSDVVERAREDVEDGKTATDKSEATEEVYRRSLRDRTPGAERD